MTIRVDIASEISLAELVALLDSHDAVLLTENGEVVAQARRVEAKAGRKERVPGALAHLGPMDDPDLFFRPDEALEGVAEAGEAYEGPPGKE